MASGFPAKTSFTDGAVLPASDLNDLGGTINKIYNATFYPYQLSLTSTSDSVLRPLPFATSTDKVSMGSLSATSGATATVTFTRSARFTEIPVMVLGANVSGSYAFASASSITTSGFTARIYNPTSVAITTTSVHYIAMQMTSAASDNN